MASVVAISGFMGSGKSSIGRVVASRLGRRFIDLDVLVERREGMDIHEIFAERGEEGFREVEEETLAQVLEAETSEDIILALGGGTVTWPESARRLAASAFVVWISVPAGELWKRVRGTPRPLARSREDFLDLARARDAAYRATADAVVDAAGLDRERVAEVVVESIRRNEAGRTVVRRGE
ncbi:MAG: shikimate kinase [Thermoleophilia bacterium]